MNVSKVGRMMHFQCWWFTCALVLLLAVALATPRRTDSAQDFEFDDDLGSPTGAVLHERRTRRFFYDPHNSLCRSLVCEKRQICVLRESTTTPGDYTPLCTTKKNIIRTGDMLMMGTAERKLREDTESDTRSGVDVDDEVFYEPSASGLEVEHVNTARRRDRTDLILTHSQPTTRCMGCGERGGEELEQAANFLCGSDNRTYSSLCRLDLHNCLRRARPPVSLACRGFCPCPSETPLRPPPSTASRTNRRRVRPLKALRNNNDLEEVSRRSRLQIEHNEVIPPPSLRRPRPLSGGKGCALDKMADRLLDWFSVVMEDATEVPPAPEGFPRGCKPEVRWMFAHLDADRDGALSTNELYSLKHDERERCLRPFLAACGAGGEEERLSRGMWCACMKRAMRPCTALARAHLHARSEGAYVPSCDAMGFYRPLQCHTALAVCWCVDVHGVELPNTRTKGTPTCPGDRRASDGVAPADDEDWEVEGSGEGEVEQHLRY